MNKQQADTLALLICKKLADQERSLFFQSKHQVAIDDFVEFAKKLSEKLQHNFDDIDLNVFRDNQ